MDIVKSKEWNWEIVKGQFAEEWMTPSVESFYLVNRWKSQNKKIFLDLGCGLGRHTVLFANNEFDVKAFDLSENAILRTKEWMKKENLFAEYDIGDMLKLPYKNSSIDCILGANVISHTDTNGVKKIVKELNRILKKDGECYLTLASKETWGFRQDWPMVDENTKLKMQDGPEYETPHFYADYKLIKELFKSFSIIFIKLIKNYHGDNGEFESYHYHVLVKK